MADRAANAVPAGGMIARATLLGAGALLCSISAITTRFEMLSATGSLTERLINLGGASAAVWFALFALIVIARRADFAAPDRADWFVAIAATACSLAPLGQIGGAGLTLLGIWCVAKPRSDPALRQAGIVMLALATTLVWGRIASQLLGPLVLVPDAWLAGLLSGVGSNGNLVGPDVILGPGCSSLHNMSIALLIWASITQAMGRAINKRLLLGLGAAILVTIAINMGRVVTIVLNMDRFDYWHTGGGAALFGFAAFLAALAVTIYVTDRDAHAHT